MTDSDEQSPYEDLKDDEVKENRNSDLTKEEVIIILSSLLPIRYMQIFIIVIFLIDSTFR